MRTMHWKRSLGLLAWLLASAAVAQTRLDERWGSPAELARHQNLAVQHLASQAPVTWKDGAKDFSAFRNTFFHTQLLISDFPFSGDRQRMPSPSGGQIAYLLAPGSPSHSGNLVEVKLNAAGLVGSTLAAVGPVASAVGGGYEGFVVYFESPTHVRVANGIVDYLLQRRTFALEPTQLCLFMPPVGKTCFTPLEDSSGQAYLRATSPLTPGRLLRLVFLGQELLLGHVEGRRHREQHQLSQRQAESPQARAPKCKRYPRALVVNLNTAVTQSLMHQEATMRLASQFGTEEAQLASRSRALQAAMAELKTGAGKLDVTLQTERRDALAAQESAVEAERQLLRLRREAAEQRELDLTKGVASSLIWKLAKENDLDVILPDSVFSKQGMNLTGALTRVLNEFFESRDSSIDLGTGFIFASLPVGYLDVVRLDQSAFSRALKRRIEAELKTWTPPSTDSTSDPASISAARSRLVGEVYLEQLNSVAVPVAKEAAKARGFDMVVQDVLYASPCVDITDDVLRRLKVD